MGGRRRSACVSSPHERITAAVKNARDLKVGSPSLYVRSRVASENRVGTRTESLCVLKSTFAQVVSRAILSGPVTSQREKRMLVV